MNTLLIYTGVFLWSLSTGLREGYTWTARRDRLPLMDYHAWRMIEQLGICLSVYGAGGLKYLLIYIGLNWAMVFTIYEPALDYMMRGRWIWFKKINPYNICGYKWNFGRWQQIALTLTGAIILCVSLLAL